MPEMTSYRHGVAVWVDVRAPDVEAAALTAVLHDPAGAVFAIGQFIAMDDPNDWPV